MCILSGLNGDRPRLWKVESHKLADERGIAIQVCHCPPGASKWNKIEHRMFCHITHNWRGRPWVSREVVVNLIGNTTPPRGFASRHNSTSGTIGRESRSPMRKSQNGPSSATSSRGSGTIGSSLVTEMLERVLFKLFLLGSLKPGGNLPLSPWTRPAFHAG